MKNMEAQIKDDVVPFPYQDKNTLVYMSDREAVELTVNLYNKKKSKYLELWSRLKIYKFERVNLLADISLLLITAIMVIYLSDPFKSLFKDYKSSLLYVLGSIGNVLVSEIILFTVINWIPRHFLFEPIKEILLGFFKEAEGLFENVHIPNFLQKKREISDDEYDVELSDEPSYLLRFIFIGIAIVLVHAEYMYFLGILFGGVSTFLLTLSIYIKTCLRLIFPFIDRFSMKYFDKILSLITGLAQTVIVEQKKLIKACNKKLSFYTGAIWGIWVLKLLVIMFNVYGSGIVADRYALNAPSIPVLDEMWNMFGLLAIVPVGIDIFSTLYLSRSFLNKLEFEFFTKNPIDENVIEQFRFPINLVKTEFLTNKKIQFLSVTGMFLAFLMECGINYKWFEFLDGAEEVTSSYKWLGVACFVYGTITLFTLLGVFLEIRKKQVEALKKRLIIKKPFSDDTALKARRILLEQISTDHDEIEKDLSQYKIKRFTD